MHLARAEALERGAGAVVVLPGDLPWLDRETLDAVLGAAEEAWSREADASTTSRVALVPDRHGSGTNVLVLAPPDVIDFAFGIDSRTEHAARARRPAPPTSSSADRSTSTSTRAEDLVLVEGIAPETIDAV